MTNNPDLGGSNWQPTPSPHIVNVTDADFDAVVLDAEKPTLVDFWAAWCRPCRQLDPAVVAVAEEYQDTIEVARLDIMENPAMADRYQVQGIPLLLLFKNGEVVARQPGVPQVTDVTAAIRTWLAEHLKE